MSSVVDRSFLPYYGVSKLHLLDENCLDVHHLSIGHANEWIYFLQTAAHPVPSVVSELSRNNHLLVSSLSLSLSRECLTSLLQLRNFRTV